MYTSGLSYEFIKHDLIGDLTLGFADLFGDGAYLTFKYIANGAESDLCVRLNSNNILEIETVGGITRNLYTPDAFKLFLSALNQDESGDPHINDCRNIIANHYGSYFDHIEAVNVDYAIGELTVKENWMNKVLTPRSEDIFSLEYFREFSSAKDKLGESAVSTKIAKSAPMATIVPSAFCPPDTIIVPITHAQSSYVPIEHGDMINDKVMQSAVRSITISEKTLTSIINDYIADDRVNEANMLKTLKTATHKTSVGGKTYLRFSCHDFKLDKTGKDVNVTLDEYGFRIPKNKLDTFFGTCHRHILDHEETIMARYPILGGIGFASRKIIVNRDPTATAIIMNPLMVKPLNADFDGDTIRTLFGLSPFKDVTVLERNAAGVYVPKTMDTDIAVLKTMSHEAIYSEMAEISQQTALVYKDVIELETLLDDNRTNIAKLEAEVNAMSDKDAYIKAKKKELNAEIKKYNKELDKFNKLKLSNDVTLRYDDDIKKLNRTLKALKAKRDTITNDYEKYAHYKKLQLTHMKNELKAAMKRTGQLKSTVRNMLPLYVFKYNVADVITILSSPEMRNIVDANLQNSELKQKFNDVITNKISDIDDQVEILRKVVLPPITTVDFDTIELASDEITKGIYNNVNEYTKQLAIGKLTDKPIQSYLVDTLSTIKSNLSDIREYQALLVSCNNKELKNAYKALFDELEVVAAKRYHDPDKLKKDLLKTIDKFNMSAYSSLAAHDDIFRGIARKLMTKYTMHAVQLLTENIGMSVSSTGNQKLQFLPTISYFDELRNPKDPVNTWTLDNIKTCMNSTRDSGIDGILDNLKGYLGKGIGRLTLSQIEEAYSRYGTAATLYALSDGNISDDVLKSICGDLVDIKCVKKVTFNPAHDGQTKISKIAYNELTKLGTEIFGLYNKIVTDGQHIELNFKGKAMSLGELVDADYGFKQVVKELRGNSAGFTHMAISHVALMRTVTSLGAELRTITPNVLAFLNSDDKAGLLTKLTNDPEARDELIRDVSRLYGISNKSLFNSDYWNDLSLAMAGGEGLIMRTVAVETPGYLAKIYDNIMTHNIVNVLEKKGRLVSKDLLDNLISDLKKYQFRYDIIEDIASELHKEIKNNKSFSKISSVKNGKLTIVDGKESEFLDKVIEMCATNKTVNKKLTAIITDTYEGIADKKARRLAVTTGTQTYTDESNKVPARYSIVRYNATDGVWDVDKYAKKAVTLKFSDIVDNDTLREKVTNAIGMLHKNENVIVIGETNVVAIVPAGKEYSVYDPTRHDSIKTRSVDESSIPNLQVPTLKITMKPGADDVTAMSVIRAFSADVLTEIQKNHIKNLKLDGIKTREIKSIIEDMIKVSYNDVMDRKQHFGQSYREILNGYCDIEVKSVNNLTLRGTSSGTIDIMNALRLQDGYLPVVPAGMVNDVAGYMVGISAARGEIAQKHEKGSVNNMLNIVSNYGNRIKSDPGRLTYVSPSFSTGSERGMNIAFFDASSQIIEDAIFSNSTASLLGNKVDDSKKMVRSLAEIGGAARFGGMVVPMHESNLPGGSTVEFRDIKFEHIAGYYDPARQTVVDAHEITLKDIIQKNYRPIIGKHTTVLVDGKAVIRDGDVSKSGYGMVTDVKMDGNKLVLDTTLPVLKSPTEKFATTGGNKGMTAVINSILATFDAEDIATFATASDFKLLYNDDDIKDLDFKDIQRKHAEDIKKYQNKLTSGRNHDLMVNIDAIDVDANGNIKPVVKQERVDLVFGGQIMVTRLEASTVSNAILSTFVSTFNKSNFTNKIASFDFDKNYTIQVKNKDTGQYVSKNGGVLTGAGDGPLGFLTAFGIDLVGDTFVVNENSVNLINLLEMLSGYDRSTDTFKNIHKECANVLKKLFTENKGSSPLILTYGDKELKLPALVGINMAARDLEHFASLKVVDNQLTKNHGTIPGRVNTMAAIAELSVQATLLSDTKSMDILYYVENGEYKVVYMRSEDSKFNKLAKHVDVKIGNQTRPIYRKTISVQAEHAEWLDKVMYSTLMSHDVEFTYGAKNTIIGMNVDKHWPIINLSRDIQLETLGKTEALSQDIGGKLTQRTMKIFHTSGMPGDGVSPALMEMTHMYTDRVFYAEKDANGEYTQLVETNQRIMGNQAVGLGSLSDFNTYLDIIMENVFGGNKFDSDPRKTSNIAPYVFNFKGQRSLIVKALQRKIDDMIANSSETELLKFFDRNNNKYTLKTKYKHDLMIDLMSPLFTTLNKTRAEAVSALEILASLYEVNATKTAKGNIVTNIGSNTQNNVLAVILSGMGMNTQDIMQLSSEMRFPMLYQLHKDTNGKTIFENVIKKTIDGLREMAGSAESVRDINKINTIYKNVQKVMMVAMAKDISDVSKDITTLTENRLKSAMETIRNIDDAKIHNFNPTNLANEILGNLISSYGTRSGNVSDYNEMLAAFDKMNSVIMNNRGDKDSTLAKATFDKMDEYTKMFKTMLDKGTSANIRGVLFSHLRNSFERKVGRNMFNGMVSGLNTELPFPLASDVKFNKNIVTEDFAELMKLSTLETDRNNFRNIRNGKSYAVPHWLRHQYSRAANLHDDFVRNTQNMYSNQGYNINVKRMSKLMEDTPIGFSEQLATPHDYMQAVLAKKRDGHALRLETTHDAGQLLKSNWMKGIFSSIDTLSKAFSTLGIDSQQLSDKFKVNVDLQGLTADSMKAQLHEMKKLSAISNVSFDYSTTQDKAQGLLATGSVKKLYDKKGLAYDVTGMDGGTVLARDKYGNRKSFSNLNGMKIGLEDSGEVTAIKVGKSARAMYNYAIADYPINVEGADRVVAKPISMLTRNKLITKMTENDSLVNINSMYNEWIKDGGFATAAFMDAKAISNDAIASSLVDNRKAKTAMYVYERYKNSIIDNEHTIDVNSPDFKKKTMEQFLKNFVYQDENGFDNLVINRRNIEGTEMRVAGKEGSSITLDRFAESAINQYQPDFMLDDIMSTNMGANDMQKALNVFGLNGKFAGSARRVNYPGNKTNWNRIMTELYRLKGLVGSATESIHGMDYGFGLDKEGLNNLRENLGIGNENNFNDRMIALQNTLLNINSKPGLNDDIRDLMSRVAASGLNGNELNEKFADDPHFKDVSEFLRANDNSKSLDFYAKYGSSTYRSFIPDTLLDANKLSAALKDMAENKAMVKGQDINRFANKFTNVADFKTLTQSNFDVMKNKVFNQYLRNSFRFINDDAVREVDPAQMQQAMSTIKKEAESNPILSLMTEKAEWFTNLDASLEHFKDKDSPATRKNLAQLALGFAGGFMSDQSGYMLAANGLIRDGAGNETELTRAFDTIFGTADNVVGSVLKDDSALRQYLKANVDGLDQIANLPDAAIHKKNKLNNSRNVEDINKTLDLVKAHVKRNNFDAAFNLLDAEGTYNLLNTDFTVGANEWKDLNSEDRSAVQQAVNVVDVLKTVHRYGELKTHGISQLRGQSYMSAWLSPYGTHGASLLANSPEVMSIMAAGRKGNDYNIIKFANAYEQAKSNDDILTKMSKLSGADSYEDMISAMLPKRRKGDDIVGIASYGKPFERSEDTENAMNVVYKLAQEEFGNALSLDEGVFRAGTFNQRMTTGVTNIFRRIMAPVLETYDGMSAEDIAARTNMSVEDHAALKPFVEKMKANPNAMSGIGSNLVEMAYILAAGDRLTKVNDGYITLKKDDGSLTTDAALGVAVSSPDQISSMLTGRHYLDSLPSMLTTLVGEKQFMTPRQASKYVTANMAELMGIKSSDFSNNLISEELVRDAQLRAYGMQLNKTPSMLLTSDMHLKNVGKDGTARYNSILSNFVNKINASGVNMVLGAGDILDSTKDIPGFDMNQFAKDAKHLTKKANGQMTDMYMLYGNHENYNRSNVRYVPLAAGMKLSDGRYEIVSHATNDMRTGNFKGATEALQQYYTDTYGETIGAGVNKRNIHATNGSSNKHGAYTLLDGSPDMFSVYDRLEDKYLIKSRREMDAFYTNYDANNPAYKLDPSINSDQAGLQTRTGWFGKAMNLVDDFLTSPSLRKSKHSSIIFDNRNTYSAKLTDSDKRFASDIKGQGYNDVYGSLVNDFLGKRYMFDGGRVANTESMTGLISLFDTFKKLNVTDMSKIVSLTDSYIDQLSELNKVGTDINDETVVDALKRVTVDAMANGPLARFDLEDGTVGLADKTRVTDTLQSAYYENKRTYPMSYNNGRLSMYRAENNVGTTRMLDKFKNVIAESTTLFGKTLNMDVKKISRSLEFAFDDLSELNRMNGTTLNEEAIKRLEQTTGGAEAKFIAGLSLAEYFRTNMNRASVATNVETYAGKVFIGGEDIGNVDVDAKKRIQEFVDSISGKNYDKMGKLTSTVKEMAGEEGIGEDVQRSLKAIAGRMEIATSMAKSGVGVFGATHGTILAGNPYANAAAVLELGKLAVFDGTNPVQAAHERGYGGLDKVLGTDSNYYMVNLDSYGAAKVSSRAMASVDWDYAAKMKFDSIQRTMDSLSKIKQYKQIARNEDQLYKNMPLSGLPSFLQNSVVTYMQDNLKEIPRYSMMGVLSQVLSNNNIPAYDSVLGGMELALGKQIFTPGNAGVNFNDVPSSLTMTDDVTKKKNIQEVASGFVGYELFGQGIDTLLRSGPEGKQQVIRMLNNVENVTNEDLAEHMRNLSGYSPTKYDAYKLGSTQSADTMERNIQLLRDSMVNTLSPDKLPEFVSKLSEVFTINSETFNLLTANGEQIVAMLSDTFDGRSDSEINGVVNGFNEILDEMNGQATNPIDTLAKIVAGTDDYEGLTSDSRAHIRDQVAKMFKSQLETAEKSQVMRYLYDSNAGDAYLSGLARYRDENGKISTRGRAMATMGALSHVTGSANDRLMMMSNSFIGPLMGALGMLWSWQSISGVKGMGNRQEGTLSGQLLESLGLSVPMYGLNAIDVARAAGMANAMTAKSSDAELATLLPADPRVFAIMSAQTGDEQRELMQWYSDYISAERGQEDSVLPSTESVTAIKELYSNLSDDEVKTLFAAEQGAKARNFIDKNFGMESTALAEPMDAVRINTGRIFDVLAAMYRPVVEIAKVSGMNVETNRLLEYTDAIREYYQGDIDVVDLGGGQSTIDASIALSREYTQNQAEATEIVMENRGLTSSAESGTAAVAPASSFKELASVLKQVEMGTRAGYSIQMVEALLSISAILTFMSAKITWGFEQILTKGGSINKLSTALRSDVGMYGRGLLPDTGGLTKTNNKLKRIGNSFKNAAAKLSIFTAAGATSVITQDTSKIPTSTTLTAAEAAAIIGKDTKNIVTDANKELKNFKSNLAATSVSLKEQNTLVQSANKQTKGYKIASEVNGNTVDLTTGKASTLKVGSGAKLTEAEASWISLNQREKVMGRAVAANMGMMVLAPYASAVMSPYTQAYGNFDAAMNGAQMGATYAMYSGKNLGTNMARGAVLANSADTIANNGLTTGSAIAGLGLLTSFATKTPLGIIASLGLSTIGSWLNNKNQENEANATPGLTPIVNFGTVAEDTIKYSRSSETDSDESLVDKTLNIATDPIFGTAAGMLLYTHRKAIANKIKTWKNKKTPSTVTEGTEVKPIVADDAVKIADNAVDVVDEVKVPTKTPVKLTAKQQWAQKAINTLDLLGSGVGNMLKSTKGSVSPARLIATALGITAVGTGVKVGQSLYASDEGDTGNDWEVTNHGEFSTAGVGLGLGGLIANVAKPLVGKAGMKVAGKTLAKTIPLLGLASTAYFAGSRMMQGDYAGAGLEVASGLLAQTGVGSIASLGIDGYLAYRDIAKTDGDIAAQNQSLFGWTQALNPFNWGSSSTTIENGQTVAASISNTIDTSIASLNALIASVQLLEDIKLKLDSMLGLMSNRL